MDVAQLRGSPSNRPKREPKSQGRESSPESDESTPARLTHTLTACCRCRQRKTRCDPSLPKCSSCERSGQICEYWDPAKKQKVPRHYVLHLMENVRRLEAELNKLIDEDIPPQDTESLIRPGDIIRLHENDETPRYLGPSSGVAITKIVMEEAKRYTDTKNIRDLVPEVRQRRRPTVRAGFGNRKQSYPMISAVPARELPSRPVADNLVRVFMEKAQELWPTLHEPSFLRDLEDVYNGTEDVYKNFIVRIVFGISLQKVDMQYSGLADSFYLSAIEKLEGVVRLKDLRALQCLILVAQYSLLTPTRTAIYYIVGLATRLSQQLGLTEEATIAGISKGQYNPLEVDLRRRLHWIVLSMEFGLAHCLGRPNAFATGRDHIDVKFFELAEDENITENGITPGPKSLKKALAAHFFKMRLIQSDIRRVLYQKKRASPKDAQDPWFRSIQAAMDEWHADCPSEAQNSSLLFTGRYNTMVVFLNRPSPQIPEPSAQQALACYEAAANILELQARGIEEVTWIFVIATHMALNTLLWSLSYSEVRDAHTNEEAEKQVECGISVLEKSRERWPSHAAAPNHYSRLAKAILRSYDIERPASLPSSLSATSPASAIDTSSPQSEQSSTTTGSANLSHTNESPYNYHKPAFTNNVFGSPNREQIPLQALNYNNPRSIPDRMPAQHTSFRSGSIFANPGSTQLRRPSSFPPEVPQLPDWGQMNPPPQASLQNALPQPMIFGQQAQSMGLRRQSIPAHLMPRDIQPFPAHSMPRAMNPFSSNDEQNLAVNSMPPGQHRLPPASSSSIQMPKPVFDSSMIGPSQVLQGFSPTFDWASQGNPFTEDYEMHDRMGSLSQEQQYELMQQLEVDGLDFLNDMNLDSDQAQWNMNFGMIPNIGH